MELKDLLKSKRIEKGLTMKELSQRIGVSESTISRYESGEIGSMRIAKIRMLSDILDIPVGTFLEASEQRQREKDRIKETSVKIPVLGDIAGGIPFEAIEDMTTDEWEEIPVDWLLGGRKYIALKVKGNSMSPRILDGDIAIIQTNSDFESGDVCAVYVNGYNATLKRVLVQDSGILLQAFNPSYESKFYTKEQCAELPVKILGRMVEFRGK